jgi:hypothetical protein
MKIIILLLLFFLPNKTNAQLFKKLGEKIKGDAEWRIRSKADQQVSNGIDSIMALPKKVITKKKSTQKTESAENKNTAVTNKNLNASGNPNAEVNDTNDMTPKDGLITLELSAPTVFAGGRITIAGESVKYKNYTRVEVSVKGPETNDTGAINLTDSGKFNFMWTATDKTGEFTVTVHSSDKKTQQSAKFTVYKLPELQNLCTENIIVTNKIYDKLREKAEQVNGFIGAKDKAELDEKMDKVKEKVNGLLKLFKGLNTAGKEVAQLAKSGKNLSPNLSGNLSALNDKMTEQRKKMEQIDEFTNHKPADNTICEYLVLLNEACAAFSVYTNIECFAVKGIIRDIMLDKEVPAAVGTVNTKAKGLSSPNDFLLKEPAKIFSTAAIDAESLANKLGTAGFAGDIVQFATDFLMKKYCGVFKGNVKHNYTIEFRNKSGQNWWTYGVEMKAVLFLRYPKDKDKGDIIKMKGNLEGNATKFRFFKDIEKEDDFQNVIKDKMKVIPIKTYMPYSVSVATSEADILGFGAIARGMATPAYFNIPVDAEYDVNSDKIKLFINNPIIDFSPAVSNQFIFILVGVDMLPYIKRMTFPIHKVFLTLGSVLSDNNKFEIKKDNKGNLGFNGKVNKHIGNKTTIRETDLNFSITAKKE